MEEQYETVKLCYTIHQYSSYSANYIPENIMVNRPSDQLSRWFTDSTTPHQYVMLKLKSPSIVETIQFGKYIKAHVSDLKKFQIFGGTDDNNLSLLLSAGLKKDSSPETFRLRHMTSEGLYLPVQYIKIVPLQSWGPAYNYTIWYVELQGKNNEQLIAEALDTINLRKEEEAVRILLKHLRRRRYKDAFEALSRESGVQLEGPLQSRLWNALVENGDYKLAEEILEEAKREGEFEWYISWQPYAPVWRQMSACSAPVEAALCCDAPPPPRRAAPPDDTPDDIAPSGGESAGDGCEADGGWCGKPGPRGGHQLVADCGTGTLYLFGGWNGTEDLDDLWSFDTIAEKWTLLCRHSGAVGGPTPRSCHKMVFDPVHRRLYTLGRYLDNAQRIPANMVSELYVYDIGSDTWWVACADTAAAGGPRLVFDHQMALDADTQTIYVFGGRALPANTEEASTPQYSGLYAYYIEAGTWQQLLADSHELPAPRPRVSHSMLFHPTERRLYIFAGQRNKEHLMELWWYDVETGCSACVAAAPRPPPPPAAGFTQRATLDPRAAEMYVLSGMSKEKDKRVYNALWVYSMRRGTWACVYRNDSVSRDQPRPRFAHQLVLDPVRKIHYLFGGNPGNQSCPRLRLDDLWALELKKPTVEDVFHSARASLREACYRELCSLGRELTALDYLRNEVREALDHNDPKQVERFQKLATVLFAGGGGGAGGEARPLCPPRARALGRRRAAPAPRRLAPHALLQVLGADDSPPEPPQPFEEVPAPPPDSWDVGEDIDDSCESPAWSARSARVRLYDALCRYFRPSTVPPEPHLADLVTL